MLKTLHISTLVGLTNFTIPTSAAAAVMVTCNRKEIQVFDSSSQGEADIGVETFQLQVGQKVDQEGDVIVLVMVGDHWGGWLDQHQLIAMAKLVRGMEGATVAGLVDQSLSKSAKAYVVDSRGRSTRFEAVPKAKDFVRLDSSDQGLYGLTDEGLFQFDLRSLELSAKLIPFLYSNTDFDPRTIHTVSRPISKNGTTWVFLNSPTKVYVGSVVVPELDKDGWCLPYAQVLRISDETMLDNHTVYGGLNDNHGIIAFRDSFGTLRHVGVDQFLAEALPQHYAVVA